MKTALVGCEFSGIVRNALVEVGVDAMSCDLLPSEQERPDGWDGHYQGDLMRLLYEETDYHFDMAIFHPPCTFLTNAGVRWLYKGGQFKNGRDEQRWREMKEACMFVNALLAAYIPQIALENPIPHKYALDLISHPYTQIIQPWMFGEWETKATCLWLKNLPPLVPIYRSVDECREALGKTGKPTPRVHHASPGPDRWKERSRTLPGIAKAMADQWGSL